MLFYPIPKFSGCASYVARIINNGNFLAGRSAILLKGWKGFPSAVNNTRIDSKETFSYGLPNLTLESQGSVTNPLKFQINWALLRTKLLNSRKTWDLLLSIR